MSDEKKAVSTGIMVPEEAEPIVVPGRMMLEDLFAGEQYAGMRAQIVETGKFRLKNSPKELHVQTRQVDDGRYEVLAVAAITRDPGKTQDALSTIADFSNLGVKPTVNLINKVRQYHQIYYNEGIINNAVNKVAALIGVGGRYKVKRAKKGKARKPIENLQVMLDYFATNVNNAPYDGVVTGERGLKSVVHNGVRMALIEGDWLARQQWSKVNLPEIGAISLPMVLQTLSLQNLEPVLELSGLGELWWWRPDSQLMNLISGGSKIKEISDVLKKTIDSKMQAQLKKEQKVLLTPALLLHVKHRGLAVNPIGESIIEPAKLGIRFSRAVTAVDLVSMENVINRLTIVQVGSADPKSPYSKADVAAARASLMQSFFDDIAPSMVIVWQGDDVKVTDVGSSASVLDLNERYRIADQKIKTAVGIPDALLLGSMGDGAGQTWASIVGAAAQMQELANSFAAVLTTLGERIAMENGYEGVELVWEFDASLMADYKDTRTQNRADYLAGAVSLHSLISASGRDPDAEFFLRCQEKGLDPDSATWEQAFAPPQGLQGQGEGGVQGQGDGKDPGAGRTPEADTTGNEPSKKTAPKTKSPKA